jgi:type 1 glutamine amidotransferase
VKEFRAAFLVGDYYHEPAAIEAMLRLVLVERGIVGTFFREPAAFPWAGLGGYDLAVVAKDARAKPEASEERWSVEAYENALDGYVEKGGKLLVLHNGLACYDPEGTYSRLVRGRFLFHPAEHPKFHIRGAEERPAPERASFFEIEDEMYFVQVDSANTEVFLRTYSPDYGSSAAAWRHRRGKGGVFCFTPGHTVAVLSDPAYRRVVLGGLEWLMSL